MDLNGTQAAIRAGYARKTANREGARLLSNVGIRARIDGVQRAVASVKVRTVDGKETVTEIKLWPKLPALEQLGKHYGLLRERTETEQHGEVHVHHHYANLDEDDGADAGTG